METDLAQDTTLGLDTNVTGVVGYRPIGQMTRRRHCRQRLVQAALKLFCSRGYHHTSIADILRESGCKRGTLYYYFSSKEELGYAAIDEGMELMSRQGAGSHLRTDEHPIDRLLWVVDSLPNTIGSGATVYFGSNIAIRMASVHEGFRDRLRQKWEAMMRQAEENTRKGVADGQIADGVDPVQLVHLMAIICAGIQMSDLLWERQVIAENARRWLKEYLTSLRK
jgi:AcrR family transcriptional regulator